MFDENDKGGRASQLKMEQRALLFPHFRSLPTPYMVLLRITQHYRIPVSVTRRDHAQESTRVQCWLRWGGFVRTAGVWTRAAFLLAKRFVAEAIPPNAIR